jgi:hypothetical protein
LKDLDRAYKNFFAKCADFPRFKKKGSGDCFRYPQGIKLEQGNNRIFLPKIGWCRYRNSRTVEGDIKNVTVSQSCGKWFAAIQTEREVAIPTPSGDMIGIDVGIARFATTINRSRNPRRLRRGGCQGIGVAAGPSLLRRKIALTSLSIASLIDSINSVSSSLLTLISDVSFLLEITSSTLELAFLF